MKKRDIHGQTETKRRWTYWLQQSQPSFKMGTERNPRMSCTRQELARARV